MSVSNVLVVSSAHRRMCHCKQSYLCTCVCAMGLGGETRTDNSSLGLESRYSCIMCALSVKRDDYAQINGHR